MFGINFPYEESAGKERDEKKEMVDKLDKFLRMKPTVRDLTTLLRTVPTECAVYSLRLYNFTVPTECALCSSIYVRCPKKKRMVDEIMHPK